jgi:phosphoribosylformylglycinamidine synthase
VIDGEEKPTSLFKLIKKTSEENPNDIVSAYKDNVAFVKGPKVNNLLQKALTNLIFTKKKNLIRYFH